MTLLTAYDAVDVPAIPGDAQIVLVYIDGQYVTYNTARLRFPNARLITITTRGTNYADLCDVESQDATPQIAAQGLRDGLYALEALYSDRSTKGDLDVACAGLPWNWFAAAPGSPAQLVPGSVGTQYAWPGYGSPGNYDISVIDSNWLNGAPSPPPAPPLPVIQEDDMFYTDPVTGLLVATDIDGNIYARPGAIPNVVTLGQHPEWDAGGAESAGGNPCVGIVSEKDADGSWGYTFLTKPASGSGSFGIYDTYHIRRDGTF